MSEQPRTRVSYTERGFLVACLGDLDQGSLRLNEIMPGAHFTGLLEREAAMHLRDHLVAPFTGLVSGQNDQLRAFIHELVDEANKEHGSALLVDLEFFQLEKLMVERQIDHYRRIKPSACGPLALEREAIRRRLEEIVVLIETDFDKGFDEFLAGL